MLGTRSSSAKSFQWKNFSAGLSVLPESLASIRMFERLGFRIDASPEARRYADAPSDLCMSGDDAPAIANVRVRVRG